MERQQLKTKAARTFKTSDGWSSRGYIPHLDRSGVTQFITIRLADSMPKEVLAKLSKELELLRSRNTDAELITYQRFKRIESLLDAGYGSCTLTTNGVGQVVIDALNKLIADGHQILRWVIMPNHIHVLIKVCGDISLHSLVRFFKGRTGKLANKILGSTGRFWFPEFFDRYIRDAEHLSRVIRYIDQNPVRAGLVKAAEDWPFGSLGYEISRRTTK
jgi:REP element-mobilizing transposase RayT